LPDPVQASPDPGAEASGGLPSKDGTPANKNCMEKAKRHYVANDPVTGGCKQENDHVRNITRQGRIHSSTRHLKVLLTGAELTVLREKARGDARAPDYFAPISNWGYRENRNPKHETVENNPNSASYGMTVTLGVKLHRVF